jgi:diguanylate cyclase (GGDEF)-like protein/PAS domain S-box-containing protein
VPSGPIAGRIAVVSADRDRSQLGDLVFAAAPDAVIVFDGDGTIMDVNPAVERMFKVSRADVIGRRIVDTLVPDVLRADFIGMEDDLRIAGDLHLLRSFGLRGDGTSFPTEMRLSLTPTILPGIDEVKEIYVGFVRDRTLDPSQDQVLLVPELPSIAADKVGEVRERLSVALGSAPVIVFSTDLDGIIEVSTGALVDTFDFPHTVVGQNIFTLFGERPDITDHYRRALSGEEFRVRVQIDDRWFDTQYQPMFAESGELRGTMGLSIETTAQIVSENSLRSLYETDPVTGLASRRHTDELLEQILVGGGPMTLLLVDLDQFKDINDSHGHAIGDQVLQRVGNRIGRTLPLGSVLGRLGGDELLIGLCTDDVADASRMAETILAEISRPMRLEVEIADLHSVLDISITASIGLAVAPRDGDTVSTLLTHADSAMYAAKRSGRAAYTFYCAEADKSSRRLTVSTKLRHAIETDALHVEYQPIQDLRSGTVTSFEALVRWDDPQLGTVSPNEFIALAETTPMIDGLFDIVLQHSLRAAVEWNLGLDANAYGSTPRALGGDVVCIGVNVAARQLRDPGFPQRILDAAHVAGFPANCIIVELTESSVMEDEATVHEVLRAIRDSGIRVTIDDYGTGYSNMSRLSDLCSQGILDAVKIDRSFVADLPAERAKTLIAMIMTMADSLGLITVAEGIEGRDQLDILRDLGCHYGQGWYLGKPMSALAAGQLIDRNRVSKATTLST